MNAKIIATQDRARVSALGEKAGRISLRLFKQGERVLRQQGKVPQERCKTCAFRLGTVPNGCLQTQADAIKAVKEQHPFMCHQAPNEVCKGWYAACQAPDVLPQCDWEFSPCS